jgi:alanine dehydrogenase
LGYCLAIIIVVMAGSWRVSRRFGEQRDDHLHLAADKGLTESLLKSGVTGLAYETIEVNRRLPLLEPMSEIAGRMSILVGGYFLAKHNQGSGVLLGGVPGVLPGKVVVLGGGTSGINAARMGQGMGADVTILEVDLERMRFLDITLHTAHTLYSNEAHLMELLPSVDLLIGAVLVPGARAPRLIKREMLRRMRPGSVLVDIAIDGIEHHEAEGSRDAGPVPCVVKQEKGRDAQYRADQGHHIWAHSGTCRPTGQVKCRPPPQI